MVQRISDYERKERDTYETPSWVTEAIIPFIPINAKIWEPACASGKMARVINAAYASDLVTDYGVSGVDFLQSDLPEGITSIVTNPPFHREAEKFIRHGIELLEDVPKSFMAMLLPIDFDSGKTRRDMFADCKMFAGKIVLTSRIVWFDREGASPTTNHAWYFWDKEHIGIARYFYHFKDKRVET